MIASAPLVCHFTVVCTVRVRALAACVCAYNTVYSILADVLHTQVQHSYTIVAWLIQLDNANNSDECAVAA
jgi:hypothetical protein